MNQNNEINEKLIETMKFNTYIVAINGYNNAVQQLNKTELLLFTGGLFDKNLKELPNDLNRSLERKHENLYNIVISQLLELCALYLTEQIPVITYTNVERILLDLLAEESKLKTMLEDITVEFPDSAIAKVIKIAKDNKDK